VKRKPRPVKFKVWNFGIPMEMTLEAGEVNSLASTVFMNGQCHSLALAIHRLTGWPMLGLLDREKDIMHVIVQSPQGYFDVNGVKPELWKHPYEVVEIRPEEVLNLEGYFKPQPRRAKSFAKTLLRQYFPDLSVL
jgi:hypothetical protein